MKFQSRDEAYRLATSSDHESFYDNWAKTYDQDFALATKYIYPQKIADILHSRLDCTELTIADLGCGTGLIAAALQKRSWSIDGFDISAGMLEEAKKKRLYRNLIQLDLKTVKEYPDISYSVIVSSGTFTLGHLGPDVIKNMLKLCADQALCLIGVNLEHFENLGFQSTFTELQSQKRIENFEIIPIPIYEDTTILNTEKNLANLCIFNFCKSA